MTDSAERVLRQKAGETGTKLAAAGGIVGALGASSCCILPLALFSLGASGAWIGRLSALTPYQPIFIGLGAASLGYGYWRAYRKPAACTEGDACARARPDRLVKWALRLATALVVLALAWPYLIPSVLG